VDSQFDTSVVAAFEAVLASASEEYRLGQDRNFVLEKQEERLPRAISTTAFAV